VNRGQLVRGCTLRRPTLLLLLLWPPLFLLSPPPLLLLHGRGLRLAVRCLQQQRQILEC
jgi:hypothetical protein